VEGGREFELEIGETASSDSSEGPLINENLLSSSFSGLAGMMESTGGDALELDRLNGNIRERHEGTGSIVD